MATADKLSYLLETKAKIKDSINNDISLIDEDTVFREYPNKIKSLSDTLKKYIPTDIKIGASVQISDAVPLNAKSLIIDGNSYQKTTTGKNLFNKNLITGVELGTIENDIITSSTITNSSVQNVRVKFSEPFDYEANTTYYFSADIRIKSGSGNLGKLNDSFTNSEKINFPDLSNEFQRYVTKTTYENAPGYTQGRLLFQIASNSNNLVIEIKNIMISKESDATFEDYTNGTSPNQDYPQDIEVIENINLSNNEDDYSVDLQGNFIGKINDIKDTLDLATGVLTKKIGKVILDGSENWVSTQAFDGYYRYLLHLNDEKLTSNLIKGVYSLNTHFYNRNKEGHGDYEYLYVQTNGSGGMTYIQSKKMTTVNEFKEWLSQNNVVLYYELEIPQEFQLEPVKIKMYEGTNNIELTSNLETSMKLEYYKDYKANREVASEVTE